MTSFKKYTPALLAFVVTCVLAPSTSFAAIPPASSPETPPSLEAQEKALSIQLSQVEANLLAGTSSVDATVSLSPGQSATQAANSSTAGVLTIGVPAFLHTTNNPNTPTALLQPITQLAKVTLQYSPCVAASPQVCLTMASSSPAYPVMTAELSVGETTNYLNYTIGLTSLSSTTATLSVTDTSFLSSIQNQLNAIASQIYMLLNK